MKIEVAVYTPVNKTFFYSCSEPIQVGMRVLVPFGSKKAIGVVINTNCEIDKSLEHKLKPIYKILDEHIVFSSNLINLAKWLSSYYFHPIGEVFKTMLPTALSVKKQKIYVLTSKGIEYINSSDDQYSQLLHNIFKRKNFLNEKTFLNKLKKHYTQNESISDIEKQRQIIKLIKYYTKNGIIEILEKVQSENLHPCNELNDLSYNQKRAIEVLKQVHQTKTIILTENQKNIVDTISEHFNHMDKTIQPFLLRGITGSGKTEIYLHLIENLLNNYIKNQSQEKFPQVLVMVPEIALTPQITNLFIQRFGIKEVALVHSAMDDNTRIQELNRIRNNQASILIGPRSAIFAPFDNLKLIVIDEEHDPSYKQTSGLHYNARDVAVVRANMEKACLLLASATPSVESYYNSLCGKYKLLELTQRVKGAILPEVKIIPTKAAITKGVFLNTNNEASILEFAQEYSPIEEEIIEALENNYKQKKQSIVIVNRRGYAFYLYSTKLRQAISCPHCSISLTFHKNSNKLKCHYCEYQTNLKEVLSQYPNDKFIIVGYGSEKVEEYLKKRLSYINIQRLDSDTISKPKILNEILQNFKEGKIDILVGTQILAKGHDFENVSLIALLEIDQLLDLPDFRVAERAFQLIVQASGRAGRAAYKGTVLMQTARINHPVISAALKHDYLEFFTQELSFRKTFAYPPFSRLILIEFSSTKQSTLNDICKLIKNWFVQLSSKQPSLKSYLKVLGPTSPPIEIIRGEHRRVLLMFSAHTELLRKICTEFLNFISIQITNNVKLKIDVDPYSTL